MSEPRYSYYTMGVKDWNQWCKSHHIKIKDSEPKNESDGYEGSHPECVRRTGMETPSRRNG